MAIHTPRLMYETFQACRLGRTNAGPALDALRTVLKRVEQTGALDLDEPDHHDDEHDDEHDDAIAAAISWFRTAMPGRLSLSTPLSCTRDRERDRSDQVAVTSRNQDLFHLIVTGVDDLRRLCARGATLAVRDLGYAFHNLPALLARPAEFDRQDYLFSFSLVAFHWNELSRDLHHAFCPVLETDLERLEQLVRKDGFAGSMFARTLSRDRS
jgi:hypothetical protein